MLPGHSLFPGALGEGGHGTLSSQGLVDALSLSRVLWGKEGLRPSRYPWVGVLAGQGKTLSLEGSLGLGLRLTAPAPRGTLAPCWG